MTIQHPSLPTEILSNIFDNRIERNNVSFETKKRKNRNVAKVGKGIVLIERRIAGRGLSEGGAREEDGAGGQNEDDIG